MELRRALSAEIDFDSRSRREVEQLRRLTSERTVAAVKRSMRRALREGG
jgi:hypothetical protein